MIIIGVILVIVLVTVVFMIIKGFQTPKMDDFSNSLNNGYVEESQSSMDDFQIDLVYHADTGREIHYSAYIPSNIDELDSVSLFITLPGWEGLYLF